MTAGAGIACTRTVRAGSAQLFLSHGVTDNAASLAAEHRRWQDLYDVTSVDARGHGLSARFTPAQLADPVAVMVEDLIALVEDRGHEAPCILIGHSMGGAVSAAAAAAPTSSMPSSWRSPPGSPMSRRPPTGRGPRPWPTAWRGSATTPAAP